MTEFQGFNEPVTEQELTEKNKRPRITQQMLQDNILEAYYFTARQGVEKSMIEEVQKNNELSFVKIQGQPHPSLDLLTFCVLVLKNGYTVVGQSACAYPENYDEDLGRRLSRSDAEGKIWSLMGYELKSQLYLSNEQGV